MNGERMSAKEYQASLATPKRGNKYGAKRTLLDGILFDSKAEASFYAVLKQREKAGEVTDIERQREYDLMVNGVLVARYRADFVFFDRRDRSRRVVDIKGVATRDFTMKRKLMKACFGIEVEVIR
ncbi:DUF1064 domain-containing protein [Ensifer sp. NPDC090286]|uniref:DUF1064 domain-containing protein n=1 Tax=Ensifer sp. NPDC090286 TaxID=3363991 RepID=UPI00383A36CF